MQEQAKGDWGGQAGVRVASSKAGVAKARQARQLLKQGDWAGASAIYKELTEAFPYDTDLRRHFLLNAFRHKDYHEVLQQSLDLADISLSQDNTAEALERYSEVLRLPELVAGNEGQEKADEIAALIEPFKPDIYFTYGDHYLAIQNPQLALQYFEVCERVAPGRWEASFGAGQAYSQMGEKEKAIESLYASVNSSPSEAASAYELLGEMLLTENRAIEELRDLFWRASKIYENYGLLDDALRLARRWLQLDPQDREMADRATQLLKSFS